MSDLVARAAADRHRPAYHFVSPAGWLNDPNGLGQWDGTYHLFYQYNPHGALHSRVHWGHATSDDLVTWRDEPVALVPGDDGPDRDGCWSGVLINDAGTPTLVYSGHRDGRERPCVATGSTDLRTWAKDPGNPVITAPPSGLDVTAYRDHCVWRHGDRWRHLVGAGLRGEGGSALLYESTDLRKWEYVGRFLTGDASEATPDSPDWTGTMWECVDLFKPPTTDGAEPLDTLVFSAWHDGHTYHPHYWTGTCDGDTFEPIQHLRLDYGGRYFYAPQSMSDDQGRRIMFAWLQEGRPDDACVAAGWSGVMSLPRTVTLGQDGELQLAPAGEVARLRGPATDHGRRRLSVAPFALGHGDQLDVELSLTLELGSAVALTVRSTEDGAEQTVLLLERRESPGGATVSLDRSRSSLDARVDGTPRSGPLPIGRDGRLAVRVLVDHSALEVFAAGRALTSRVYPTRADALGVSIAVLRGNATLEGATTWPMRGTWEAERRLWP